MGGELEANGCLEFEIACQNPHAQQGGAMQTISGPTGLATARPAMTATVDGLVAVDIVHAGDTPAEPTADLAREQVLAPSLPLGVAALGGLELLLIDQGGGATRKPVARGLDLTDISPIETDCAHRGVLDPDFGLDLEVTEPLGPQREDALDERGHLVRHQLTIEHVVTGRWMVLPASAFCCLALAHTGVLHDLVAVVLGEDARHADLHLARRAGKVEVALVDRVDDDSVRGEDLDQV